MKQYYCAHRLPGQDRARLIAAAATSLSALFLGCTIGAVAAATATATEPAPEASRELADLSIEELMNESITSVGKKEQRIGEAAAAIYVLTGEEILRAGYNSIPEALRMVPGLSVARLASHTWVITARGFAGQYAGKLLVLIDGRSVYDPFFSGVSWDTQDVPLEDLDRIEVIRGPGATLWGSNAVNGVINIITKKASDTQGGLAVAGGGPQERAGTIRYGGNTGNAQYRTYFKYNDSDAFVLPDGTSAQDQWHMWRAGFRSDWQATQANGFTLQGDVYDGREGYINTLPSLTPPYSSTFLSADHVSGGNVLGRWTHTSGERSSWSLQFDAASTKIPSPQFGIYRSTFNLEFQQQLDWGSRQTVVYGAGYRFIKATYVNSFLLIDPEVNDADAIYNVFLQDEIALVKHRLSLSLGAKVEHTEFSGYTPQPSARLLWTPDHDNSVWASVSRAERTPNPQESESRFNVVVVPGQGSPAMPPILVSVLPNPNLASETLLAYELGYRLQPNKNVYLDIAAFDNVYGNLIFNQAEGVSLETSPPPVHLTVASRFVNDSPRKTHGIEIAPTWQVTEWWKLAGGYTWLQMNLAPRLVPQEEDQQAGDTPQHQCNLRSSMQWARAVTFDTAIYYVDSLPEERIPSYLRLDARLGWRVTDDFSMSLTGTNLLQDRHTEFLSYAPVPEEIPRTLYAKLTWRF
jgi:iron complex outermembrane receptor protein